MASAPADLTQRPMTPHNRKRGGGRSVAGELMHPLYCYAVRKSDTRAAVCVATVASFHELCRAVDRYAPADQCEYALTSGVVVSWASDITAFPPDFNEAGSPVDIYGKPNDGLSPPSLDDGFGARGIFSDKLKWFPLGSSVVYAVRSGARVKVGFSTNLPQRLKDLNAQAAEPVELIAEYPGDLLAEALIQDEFAERFVHGEWMELDKLGVESLLHMMRNTADG